MFKRSEGKSKKRKTMMKNFTIGESIPEKKYDCEKGKNIRKGCAWRKTKWACKKYIWKYIIYICIYINIQKYIINIYKNIRKSCAWRKTKWACNASAIAERTIGPVLAEWILIIISTFTTLLFIFGIIFVFVFVYLC